MLEGKSVGRNVFLLFQPAEETGAGAAPCCELFEKESVAEIYGAHNLPGFPEGEVYTKPGTFACASRGVTLRFRGLPRTRPIRKTEKIRRLPWGSFFARCRSWQALRILRA